MRRVVVTGIGVVSPIGGDRHAFSDALLHARSGIRLIPGVAEVGLEALVVGQVSFDPTAHFTKMQAKQLDRVTQFSLVAVREAMRHAGLEISDAERDMAGVYWGTGLGGINTLEEAYISLYRDKTGRTRPLSVVLGMNNAAAANISMEWGLRGPSQTLSNACASSSMAIGEALRVIRAGQADVLVAGGAEALLTPGTLRAWQMMGTLARTDAGDPSRSCKPFSADRSGLVLAEGAAAVILEEETHARRRGATILAELAGYGCSSDAAHISKPDALGQARAMRAALKDAGLNPSDIGYVNAHGTATEVGDISETEAIRAVFGQTPPPVSSTKAVHGHLIGAAGAIEFLAGLVALREHVLPPTAHLDMPDPACDLDYVPNTARRVEPLAAFLSNSFAFGGSNAVLVARRHV
jgi:3-oxoacyl-[acyl-carrier-protein] synthase II